LIMFCHMPTNFKKCVKIRSEFQPRIYLGSEFDSDFGKARCSNTIQVRSQVVNGVKNSK